jgi:hypothetical protein
VAPFWVVSGACRDGFSRKCSSFQDYSISHLSMSWGPAHILDFKEDVPQWKKFISPTFSVFGFGLLVN